MASSKRRKDYNVAHATLERIVQETVKLCLENKESNLPYRVEQLGFAALYICYNASLPLKDDLDDLLKLCIKTVRKSGSFPQYDCLPWQLCFGSLYGFDYAEGTFEYLIGNFTHESSSVREYVMKLGWIVKSDLNIDDCAQPLLRNVANTLGGWDMAAGLCSKLFDNDDMFLEYAKKMTDFGTFQDQYDSRLESIEELKPYVFCLPHLTMEQQIHELIHSISLELLAIDFE